MKIKYILKQIARYLNGDMCNVLFRSLAITPVLKAADICSEFCISYFNQMSFVTMVFRLFNKQIIKINESCFFISNFVKFI